MTVETVAGITAMQDLASRTGLALAEGTEPVTLVPLNGGVAALDQALARAARSSATRSAPPPARRPPSSATASAAARLDHAVIGARLGLPASSSPPPPKSSAPPRPPAALAPPHRPPTRDSMNMTLYRRAVESHFTIPASAKSDIRNSVSVHADPPGRRDARIGGGLAARPRGRNASTT